MMSATRVKLSSNDLILSFILLFFILIPLHPLYFLLNSPTVWEFPYEYYCNCLIPPPPPPPPLFFTSQGRI